MTVPANVPIRRRRRRQLKIWLSDSEYFLVKSEAEANEENVSAVIRRLIRERLRHGPDKLNLGTQ
jgi:hypothetical protein